MLRVVMSGVVWFWHWLCEMWRFPFSLTLKEEYYPVLNYMWEYKFMFNIILSILIIIIHSEKPSKDIENIGLER